MSDLVLQQIYELMYILIVFIIATTITLILGLFSMGFGNKMSRKFGTKLMVLRVAFQALALLFLVMAYFFTSIRHSV